MNRYAKAMVGAVIAALGPLYLGLDDEVMSLQEWTTVAATGLTALAVVWGVPNAPAEIPTPAPTPAQEG